MDPYTLSKIGNVTIQPIPSKSDISDNRKKDTSVEPSPKPLQSIHLLKLPPSIDITIKSVNITAEVNESGNILTNTNTEKSTEENDYNSEYNEEIKLTEQKESENTIVDGDPLVNFEPETCNKTENKVNEEFLESSFENSTEVDSEGEQNDLEADNAVDIVKKMDLEGITEGEVLEPADVLEELPKIKDELVDEGFREDEEQCSDDIPNIPVEELIEDELPDEMMCKEEKFSDEEEESESDDADDELDEKQTTTNSSSKKKRKTKSEGDTKDSKKQKTSSPSSGKKILN